MTRIDMMRRMTRLALAATVGLAAVGCVTAHGQAPSPYPITINSQSATVPGLAVYRASERTIRASYYDAATPSDISAYIPFLAWSTNENADAVVTASWSFVSGTTGQVDFVWSSSDLNYAPGRYWYEVGVTTSGVPTTYRHGMLTLRGSPFGAGADPVSWTTNWNLSLVTLTGAIPAANLTEADPVWAAASGGVVYAESDPIWAAASGSVVYAEAQGLADVLANNANANAVAITNLSDLSGTGRSVFGTALSVSDINAAGVGARQSGNNAGGTWTIGDSPGASQNAKTLGGALTLGGDSAGASQNGFNNGTMTIGISAFGASQNGRNEASGTLVISNAAYGASQNGYNNGTMIIGIAAYGASQNGRNEAGGTLVIGNAAYGASQWGHVAVATATNNAVGAMQLLALTNNQSALTTADGAGSILLGAGTASNRYAIVAGDGQVSYANGSITAGGGFFGVGSGITSLNGANITVGTITTNALDATADAAYRGGGGGGSMTSYTSIVVVASYTGADMTATNNISQKINFNTEELDLYGELSGTTFTPKRNRTIAVASRVHWYNTNANFSYILFLKRSVVSALDSHYLNSATTFPDFTERVLWAGAVTTNDTFTIEYYQNSGGNETLAGSAAGYKTPRLVIWE